MKKTLFAWWEKATDFALDRIDQIQAKTKEIKDKALSMDKKPAEKEEPKKYILKEDA